MINPAVATFDVEYARSQFPYFQANQENQIAFFENAGGTLPCQGVVHKLNHFYTYNKVQPYPFSTLNKAAETQMEQGRRAIAELLGLPEETITIGASTTQNFNTLSIACSQYIQEGDEIIVSEQDHEANIGGWVRFSKLNKATLKFWPINEATGELDLSDLDKLLTEKTKLVSITHSSNILGSINPIKTIAERVHRVGAKIVVDGVSYAPHYWPDIPSYGVDAYCFSTYKTFGTHQGVMYVSPDFMKVLVPQCHFFNENKLAWKLLDSSGPDHASIAALAGIGELYQSLHAHHFGDSSKSLYEKTQEIAPLMHHYENELGKRVLEGIQDLPIKLLGKQTMDGREANFAIQLLKGNPVEVAQFLGDHGISIGQGHFYAYRLLQKLGIENLEEGVIRISLAHYNTQTEVDQLIQALRNYFNQK